MTNADELPGPADSLFRLDPRGSVNADLACLKGMPLPSLYSAAFKQAGDAILEQFEQTFDWYREPELFMPAMFCYRHYVELILKWHLMGARAWRISAVSDGDLGKHELDLLWKSAKPVIHTVWPTCEPDTLGAVERLVLEMHAIDPSSQNMRYASDRRGNHTLTKVPDIVSLDHLRGTMMKLWRFFQRFQEEWEKWMDQQPWDDLPNAKAVEP